MFKYSWSWRLVCLRLCLLLEVLFHSFARIHVHAELDEGLVARELLLVQLVQDFFLPLLLEGKHHSSDNLRLLGWSRCLWIVLNCHVCSLAYRLNIELGEYFCNLVLRVLGHLRVRIKLLKESIALDVHLVEDKTILLVLIWLETGLLGVVLIDVLIIFFTFHFIELLMLFRVQICLVLLHLCGHLVALSLIADCLTLIWRSGEALPSQGLHQLIGNW